MLSTDKLYLLNDEYDDYGIDSRSAGRCNFYFRFDASVGSVGKYVGRVSGVGSDVFVPTGIESISDVVPLVMFVPRGVESKGDQLIESFWRPKS